MPEEFAERHFRLYSFFVLRHNESGKAKVVFTNGIFDLLHPGHLELLKYAKSLGDTLVVGINSDRSTKVLKGESRPIHSEAHRKAILESLIFVDQVIVYDEERPTKLICDLMPDIVVKGGEYSLETIRTVDQIPDSVEIVVCQVLKDDSGEKISTTAAIEKLRNSDAV